MSSKEKCKPKCTAGVHYPAKTLVQNRNSRSITEQKPAPRMGAARNGEEEEEDEEEEEEREKGKGRND